MLSASLVNNLVAKPSTAKTINALLDVIQEVAIHVNCIRRSRVIAEKRLIQFHVEEKKLLGPLNVKKFVKFPQIVTIWEVTSNTIVTLVPVPSAKSCVANLCLVDTCAMPRVMRMSRQEWRRMAKLPCHGRSEVHSL